MHEMSRIKKKNHILFCLCFKTGWLIDSKPYIIVPSRQMARSCFALQSQFSAASHNPTHLHNLPIKRGLGCFICVLQGSHQSLGINIVTSYHIPFCKNLPRICLQHLLADPLQIIAAEIHTKATGKFLSHP